MMYETMLSLSNETYDAGLVGMAAQQGLPADGAARHAPCWRTARANRPRS